MPALLPDARRRTLIGVILVLVASVCFSARGVIIKLAYPYGVSPEALLALRMIFSLPGFLIMAAFARGAATTAVTRADWGMILGIGFIGYYLSSYLSFLGLQFVPAALERLLLYLTPTMVVVLSALTLKHPIRRHHVLALALSYGGIMLVFGDNVVASAEPVTLAVGCGLVFASALTYTVYLIASGTIIPRLGAARFAAYASTVACLLVFAHFLALHDIAELDLPMPVYVYGLVMAVFCTVLPTWWIAEGIRRLGSNQASMVSSIGPVSTIALASVFLGEPITPIQIAGAALVLAGVWLVSVKREAPPPASPAKG
jgi:drug/metabolite transporter (DMT)-like permease